MGLSFALTGPICSQSAMISWFSIKRSTTIGIVMTGAALGGALSIPRWSRMIQQPAICAPKPIAPVITGR